MSIETMTRLSCVMYATAGISAAAAVVLYFVLDIAKCWRMVRGRRAVPEKGQHKPYRTASKGKAATKKLARVPVEKPDGIKVFAENEKWLLDMEELPAGEADAAESVTEELDMTELVMKDSGTEALVTKEPHTEELFRKRLIPCVPAQETVLLECAEDAAQDAGSIPSTAALEMIQDIVYMQDAIPYQNISFMKKE